MYQYEAANEQFMLNKEGEYQLQFIARHVSRNKWAHVRLCCPNCSVYRSFGTSDELPVLVWAWPFWHDRSLSSNQWRVAQDSHPGKNVTRLTLSSPNQFPERSHYGGQCVISEATVNSGWLDVKLRRAGRGRFIRLEFTTTITTGLFKSSWTFL